MKPIYPNKGTQERRMLDELLKMDGEWIHKRHFCNTMGLTQAGRALWNLEKKFHWVIEHSDFTDDFGFKSYRLVEKVAQLEMF